MVNASQLYGSFDYPSGPGIGMRSITNRSITNSTLSDNVTITGKGFVDHIDLRAIALSMSSNMSTGEGLTVVFTTTVDGTVVTTTRIIDLFKFLGTGETSVIKSEARILPINTRYNTSINIAWVATRNLNLGINPRIDTNFIVEMRFNGITY